jgi:hypothetical protein
MKPEASGGAEWKGCRQTQKDTRTTAQSKAHFVWVVLPADDMANMFDKSANMEGVGTRAHTVYIWATAHSITVA